MSDELHAEHREGRGDVEAERFWEDHYRRRERVWSGRPNPVLVDASRGWKLISAVKGPEADALLVTWDTSGAFSG